MGESIKKFLKSELFLYLFIGFLTTVVNIVAFALLKKAFNANSDNNANWKIAEVLAFIIAVLFAFITNKLIVFKSPDMSIKTLGKEFSTFVTARVITEVINFFMMWYMIDMKHCNEMFTKILASVIVIVLNYIFSKFIFIYFYRNAFFIIFKKSTNV
ncbi:MAG: GtrA family protein [Lachnospiraceae bacterium]|nr:GtrA family protein [Lachnospiraceae bacterium]